MSKRLGIFATHPIQYFAPMWRALAATPGLELKVHFFSDHSVRGDVDPDFGVKVAWDVPILEGYDHCFLTRDADLARPRSVAMPDPRGVFDRGRFDAILVHGYMHRFEVQAVREARRRGIRTLLRGEHTDMQQVRRRGRLKGLLRHAYLRWFYRRIDAFCYIGSETRNHFLKYGIPADRLFFSPYSVDTDLLERQRAAFDRSAARRELGILESAVVFLFSGKLIPRKGLLVLAEAVRHLERGADVYLILMGSGDLKERLEKDIGPVLGPRLLMPGFVNQTAIGRYFAASDVFVLPSHRDTWGLVVNEAMLFGLPCIVSTMVGCRHDLIREGETGYVFPDGDAKALAAAMMRFVEDRPSIRRMGEAARALSAGYNVEASARGICQAVGLDAS